MARLRRSYGLEVGDTVTDLGLVKVDRTGLPTATFTDAWPALGDTAVVLGSPLGLSGSVAAGVIAGFDRDPPPGTETPSGLVGLDQTDAPISPGLAPRCSAASRPAGRSP